MKQGPSLTEERQALLDQIHASRDAYRRMLSSESNEKAEKMKAAEFSQANQRATFPRSKTIGWIMEHPYATAAGVVALALALPTAASASKRATEKASRAGKRIRSNRPVNSYPTAGRDARFTARPVPDPNGYDSSVHGAPPYGAYPQPVYMQEPTSKKAGAAAGVAAFGGTALTSLITIATMIMRDPAKMRMAMNMLDTASDFLRKARAGKMAQSGPPKRTSSERTAKAGKPANSLTDSPEIEV